MSCRHSRVKPEVCDQTLGVACIDCKEMLHVCWMGDHISEVLWNRACLHDDECIPCMQNRATVCALCGATILTRGQRWADGITQFSGSWAFIGWFAALCVLWIATNASGLGRWDPYPFLFLNWVLTVVSTFQSPLILLSQNRQNEMDRERMQRIMESLEEMQRTIARLEKR